MVFFHFLPTWLLAAFLAVAFTVTYELITKSVLNRREDHHPTAFAAAAFLTCSMYAAAIYIFMGVKQQDFQNLLIPRLGGILFADIILYTLAPFFYYRALKRLPLSEVTILYSLTGMFALIIGVMLGTESFYLIRLIGGIVILFSVGLLTIQAGKWKADIGFWLMLGATFFYSLAAIADNQLISHGYFSIFFIVAITFGVPALLLLIFDKAAREHFTRMFQRSVFPVVAISAFFFLTSFSSLFIAYQFGGTTSQVSFTLSTEVIVVVLLAAIFLKERKDFRKKILAAILACIGIFLLR